MYPDIDYINEIYFYSFEILKKVKCRKHLNEDIVNEMLCFTFHLLNLLELYLDDKCDY